MGRGLFKATIFTIFILNFIFLPIIWYYTITSDNQCSIDTPKHNFIDRSKKFEHNTSIKIDFQYDWQIEHLAVIVTHKDRFRELIELVPTLSKFISKQKIPHTFWIMNQVDFHRFNKGTLYNLGFKLSSNVSSYIALQDIDLIPLNSEISYKYRKDSVMHLSSPDIHPVYSYKDFLGGIVLITNEHYSEANGFSNNFWGWGREDDEFNMRLKESKIPVNSPKSISTGKKDTFFHNHLEDRKRDKTLYYNQKVVSFRRDRMSGLNTLESMIENYSVIDMTIEGYPCKVVNVKVKCNYELTPFCDTPDDNSSQN